MTDERTTEEQDRRTMSDLAEALQPTRYTDYLPRHGTPIPPWPPMRAH